MDASEFWNAVFMAKICERETISKTLSRYITAFDYFDNFLFVLSATSGAVFITSFASDIGAPIRIICASFSFAFSISNGIVKKLLKSTGNKKKKLNIIV